MSAPFQSTLNPYATPAAPASNPLGWANINTYAPWTTPDGSTGSNPSFGGYGATTSQAPHPDLWNGFGTTNLFGGLFGMAKKRSSPDFYAPSYQGTLFNPDTGPYAQDYLGSAGLSPQGLSADQSLQNAMQGSPGQSQSQSQPANPLANSSLSGPQFGGANGLQSSQMYIGQNPYGTPGASYVPGQGSSMSYGGYGNYGGFGASNSGIYQPGT